MPDQRFTVQLNPDDLAVTAFAAALSRPERSRRGAAEHHGAHDERQAARQRSERARAGRASGATTGRSYAFRRS
ncbi:hypothetical protein [Actinoplanes sp. M2I2]|uniref:hypothetical protein n=1 Tax=Actinoplanes sp. M2I2 TaxID=1734444 RepID=UPI002021DE44|nr:hypothetical protein [Actinoplanes sp. M2I2]